MVILTGFGSMQCNAMEWTVMYSNFNLIAVILEKRKTSTVATKGIKSDKILNLYSPVAGIEPGTFW
jgi:hypothetical protein